MQPTTKQIKDERTRIAYQFELEAVRLGFVVEKTLSNFRYVVRDTRTGEVLTGMVVRTTFDFYEFRLNKGKRRVDVLIVHRHNAVVPVRVVSLSQVEDYPPLDVPPIVREHGQCRTHEESQLLLSKLILNFESAEEELARLTERTRRRYNKRRNEYLTARVGRPWAT